MAKPGRAGRAEPLPRARPYAETVSPVKVLRTIVRAGRVILKRAALIAGAINSAPLKPASFRSFLAGTRKEHTAPSKEILHLNFSPQPLWNVERISVDKFRRKNPSTPPVENIQSFHIWLWIKIRCAPKQKGTYPHNFALRLLLLPKLIYTDIYSNLLTRKETDYALYL